jgi:hypothetical protein
MLLVLIHILLVITNSDELQLVRAYLISTVNKIINGHHCIFVPKSVLQSANEVSLDVME